MIGRAALGLLFGLGLAAGGLALVGAGKVYRPKAGEVWTVVVAVDLEARFAARVANDAQQRTAARQFAGQMGGMAEVLSMQTRLDTGGGGDVYIVLRFLVDVTEPIVVGYGMRLDGVGHIYIASVQRGDHRDRFRPNLLDVAPSVVNS